MIRSSLVSCCSSNKFDGDLEQAMRPSTPILESVPLLESAPLGILDMAHRIDEYPTEAGGATRARVGNRVPWVAPPSFSPAPHSPTRGQRNPPLPPALLEPYVTVSRHTAPCGCPIFGRVR